jgi:hypothetical protein
LVFAAIAFLACLAAPTASRAEPVELELILAVDTSLSVSDAEFRLQMEGLADAFRHEAVIAAIRVAGGNGIGVTLIQWSDRTQQEVSLDWSLIRDAAESRAFADRIDNTPRNYFGAGTALAAALNASIPMFDNNGLEGSRRVIDVSGDGIDNRGPLPPKIRDLAVMAGITINGLAILNEDPYLDLYYARNVIGGTGAFVITASDYVDFAQAIVRKLVREIAAPPVAGVPDTAPDEHTRMARRAHLDRKTE